MSARSRARPWFRLRLEQFCPAHGWVTFHHPVTWGCEVPQTVEDLVAEARWRLTGGEQPLAVLVRRMTTPREFLMLGDYFGG